MSYIGGTSSSNYIGAKPSAGGAAPTGGGENAVFYENDQSITEDYTIVAAKNAMTAGPITVDTGVTLTIETGARWVVL